MYGARGASLDRPDLFDDRRGTEFLTSRHQGLLVALGRIRDFRA